MTEHFASHEVIEVFYTNYRRETRCRRIVPLGLRWGTTEWHPEPCWLLKVIDVEEKEQREFALADCDFRHAQYETRITNGEITS